MDTSDEMQALRSLAEEFRDKEEALARQKYLKSISTKDLVTELLTRKNEIRLVVTGGDLQLKMY